MWLNPENISERAINYYRVLQVYTIITNSNHIPSCIRNREKCIFCKIALSISASIMDTAYSKIRRNHQLNHVFHHSCVLFEHVESCVMNDTADILVFWNYMMSTHKKNILNK